MERKPYMDFIKGLAIMGVIVCHLTTEWIGRENSFGQMMVYQGWYGLARFAVPAFFMVSGALLLAPERSLSIKRVYRDYIVPMIGAAFLYGSIYKILRTVVLRNEMRGLLSLVADYFMDFLTGRMEFHFWYVYAILGIYISLPIMRAFVKAADQTVLRYYLLVWMLLNFFFILSKSGYLTFLSGMLDQYHFVGMFVEYLGYPILGYYILAQDISEQSRHMIYGGGCVGLLIGIGLTIYDVATYGQYRWEYLAYCSPFIILYSTALTLLLKNIRIDYSRKWSSLICTLGQNTLGIYFIHMVFIIAFIQTGAWSLSVNPLLDVVGYMLVVLLGSIVIVKILKKIPIIGRWM